MVWEWMKRLLQYKLMPLNRLFILSNKKILFLIIIFAIFLRIHFFVGMAGYDDFLYSQLAYKIINQKFDILEIGGYAGSRFSILLPVAVLFSLFGINEFSTLFSLFLCSIGNVILVFYIGELILTKE